MSREGRVDFDELMARLRSGDQTAEAEIFGRYVRRLIALAAGQFDAWMRMRADVEDVVLSAYRSFFLRNRRGEFNLGDWEELWSLLAVITLRKCGNRRKHLRAARRDVRREVGKADDGDLLEGLADRTPTPEEAAILTDTIEHLFRVMTPGDRPIVEMLLMGSPTEEIAASSDVSMRTVRRVRQRARSHLERLIGESRAGDQ